MSTAADRLRPPPLHERIRADIAARILSGEWPPGHRIPFEHELIASYGCARMTVSKALGALAESGLIVRRRRAGSFVAAPRADRAMLEIGDFVAEARAAGQPYRHEILDRMEEPSGEAEWQRFALPAGTPALKLLCRHWIGERPAAFEERLILTDAVPAARAESFDATPPGTWLLDRVPWTNAEHVIRAVSADSSLARALDVPRGSACLALDRRTWQGEAPITAVRLTYPGDRHRFVARFTPVGSGSRDGR